MIKCPGSRWTLDLNLEGLIQSRTIGEVPWPIAKKVRCYLPVKGIQISSDNGQEAVQPGG